MRRWRHIAITMSVLLPGCAMADIGAEGDPTLEEIEFAADNGIFLDNGLNLANGMNLGNGTSLSNGMNLGNGIDLDNGMNLGNGVDLGNGLNGPHYAPPAGSGLEQWIDVDPVGRKRILRYLVECALPAGVAVQIRYRGSLETLGHGVAGLGPSLQDGLMNDVDQQRVSACMLARVNGTGQIVPIDMFGPMEDVVGFTTSTASDAAFPVREAAFFGNLFSDAAPAFACAEQPYLHTEMRSCKDLGGDIADCGVLSFTFRVCGDQDDHTVECFAAYTSGSPQRLYYHSCASDGQTWPYVLTTYIAGKPDGEACFLDDECASHHCAGATRPGVCDEAIADGGQPPGSPCTSNSECASGACSKKRRVCF